MLRRPLRPLPPLPLPFFLVPAVSFFGTTAFFGPPLPPHDGSGTKTHVPAPLPLPPLALPLLFEAHMATMASSIEYPAGETQSPEPK